MINKLFASILMCLLVVACSSSYTPGEATLAYMRSMTPAQAQKILQQRIWGDAETKGICGSRGFWFDERSDMVLHRDRIALLAHKRGRELKKHHQGFDDIVVFEKQYYQYSFDLNRISSIFIYDDPLLLPVFPNCNQKNKIEDYLIVDLFVDQLTNLKFIVLKKDFDKTMAALLIWLPDKPIILK